MKLSSRLKVGMEGVLFSVPGMPTVKITVVEEDFIECVDVSMLALTGARPFIISSSAFVFELAQDK